MTTEEFRDLLRRLLEQEKYERENLPPGDRPRIQAITASSGGLTVAFSDGARFRVTVAQEGGTP